MSWRSATWISSAVPDPDGFVIMCAHKGAVRKYSPDFKEAENYASYPSYADYLDRRKKADENARRFLQKFF